MATTGTVWTAGMVVCLLWSVSLAGKGTTYYLLSLNEARSLSSVQIGGQMPNVSRCQCGWKCNQHSNCTMFLYNKIIRTCAMYGREYTKDLVLTFPNAPSTGAQWKVYNMMHACPRDSIHMKLFNKCYLVHNLLDKLPAHTHYCKSLDGRLLQFSSMQELEFIRSILYHKNETGPWIISTGAGMDVIRSRDTLNGTGNSAMSYYVGAEILIPENRTFIWTNTSRTLALSDPLWQSGHPDITGTSDKNCAEISKTSDYSLRDASCTENKGCICEFPF